MNNIDNKTHNLPLATSNLDKQIEERLFQYDALRAEVLNLDVEPNETMSGLPKEEAQKIVIAGIKRIECT